MRVLAIASSGELGGAELALLTFLEHRPDDVEPTALVIGRGPLAGRLADGALPTWCAPELSRRPQVSEAVRFSRSLRRLLAATRPDVVWACGQKAALLSVATCRAAGVPLVWHKVDFSRDSFVAMPLAAAANGVVASSRAVAAALRGPVRRRLLAVPGPPVRLPRDATGSEPPTTPTVGTLARLVPYKGHALILDACARLVDEFPGLRIVLAGAPSAEHTGYPQELRDLADRLGVGGRLHLPGFVDDAPSVLRRLTVFVNATHRDESGFGLEGLSAAMLEASWAGLPVVAVDGGGTAEGMIDGRTGTLVPRADPGLLAEALAPYLRDPVLARRAGSSGAEFARERFAPEVTSGVLFAALRRAAAASGGTQPET